MNFCRATELAHQLVRERVQPGDLTIDATVGNGHDTLFLAEACGPEGHVIGFDIQGEAIEATGRRLEQAGLSSCVTLHECSHKEMGEKLSDLKRKVRVVMFNLGYLPGGDKAMITRSETTVAALQDSLDLLALGGLISVVVYPGHSGGKEEAEAVEKFAASLDQENFSVIRYGFLNQANHPPFLIAIDLRNA